MGNLVMGNVVKEHGYMLDSITLGMELESLTKPFDTYALSERADDFGWRTHRDVSVGNGNGEGFEAVSPILRLEDVNDQWGFISELCRHIQPTDTAGLHVHVGIRNLNVYDEKKRTEIVRRMVKFWCKWEDLITDHVAKRKTKRSRWVHKYGYQNFRKRVLQLVKSHGSIYSMSESLEYRDRYRTLNLKSIEEHGTLEFRIWNSSKDAPYVAMAIQVSYALIGYTYLYVVSPHMFEEDYMSLEQFKRFYDELCTSMFDINASKPSVLQVADITSLQTVG